LSLQEKYEWFRAIGEYGEVAVKLLNSQQLEFS